MIKWYLTIVFYWVICIWKVAFFAASAGGENRSFSNQNFVWRKLSKWKLWVRKLLSLVSTFRILKKIGNWFTNEGCRAISVRHVSTGDDFIYSSGIICLVPFLATMEAVAPPENNLIMLGTSIRSFRHLEHQNLSIISEDIGRNRWLQKKVRSRSRSRRRKSY